MINASYRKCLCPGCDCGEDCNGFWGTPNQDKAYQCCWSVGDKVKMTHTIETNFQFKGGGIVIGNACYEQSYSCGRILESSSSTKIEVEYVCIGARGNAHTNPSPFADLPDYISGVAWKDEGKGADPELKDGWDVYPISYIPLTGPGGEDPEQALVNAKEGETIWEYGEYVTNTQHIPGCASNWPFRYQELYSGFIAAKDSTSQTLYWEPIPIPTDQEPKTGSLTKNCNCLNYILKNTYTCQDYTQIDENCVCECIPQDNCANPSCISSETPNFCYGERDTDGTLLNCNRIDKCNPNSDCSCFIPIYIKESDLSETDHGFEVDEEGYILDTDGEKIPSGKYRGRYENSISQSATIFALDLTNPDIQYCEYGGYFIERQVSHEGATKWQKYELQPFLVLFNRPILEWDCDCKDENDNYILPDGVGVGYRKEVAGGFSWYFWSGACDLGCDDCPKILTAPAPCVAGCELIVDDFVAGKEFVPCKPNDGPDVDSGPKWRPFSADRATLSGFSTADFFTCTNCVEGISSCAGFKSYCIKRRNVTPEGENTCPGQCGGFYGVMAQAEAEGVLCTGKEGIIDLACSYGCAELAKDLCDGFTSCSIGQRGSSQAGPIGGGGPEPLIYPPAYQRSTCESYAIHTLIIEPVQEDQRRCLWYDFETNGKNFRCCGKSGKLGGSDVGSPINIEFETNTDNDLIIKYNSDFEDLQLNIPNNLDFSWTEGIGWVSSCKDLGNPYIADTDETSVDGNNYSIEVLCDVNPSSCDQVQCSGTTEFGVDLAKGIYPCVLSPTARTCCQLPYDVACIQDSWWPHGQQNDYGSSDFWFIQNNVSNGNILTGCSCYRPSCSCYFLSEEEPEGRYVIPGDIEFKNSYIYIPQCDPDNYTVKSDYYRDCVNGCFYYTADIYGCTYDPNHPAGKQSDDCLKNCCPGVHQWPDGCTENCENDPSDCPTWCSGYCEGNENLQIEGWVCGDCNDLCNGGIFIPNP